MFGLITTEEQPYLIYPAVSTEEVFAPHRSFEELAEYTEDHPGSKFITIERKKLPGGFVWWVLVIMNGNIHEDDSRDHWTEVVPRFVHMVKAHGLYSRQVDKGIRDWVFSMSMNWGERGIPQILYPTIDELVLINDEHHLNDLEKIIEEKNERPS